MSHLDLEDRLNNVCFDWIYKNAKRRYLCLVLVLCLVFVLCFAALFFRGVKYQNISGKQ